jgi:exonuclease SbcD
MRILHTADWHLNDRLGRIDRTDDLRKAVERVAVHCHEQKIDVLLVAGDLFSELARPDALRETIRHWQDVFADFLARGGTILTCTGNHDNENFCQTLRHAMALAAPSVDRLGELVPPGRLYLAAEPTFLRLHDPKANADVQFMMMPYPTPTRYLKGGAGQKYANPEEKLKLLVQAFEQTIQEFRQHPKYQPDAASVLAAHANVFGAVVGESLFRISPKEDVVVSGEKFADQFAYVALGHIHREQFLGHNHIRYSGSVEKLDLGESRDHKSVTVFELRDGQAHDIVLLPMPSTPIYEVNVLDPEADLPHLKAEYAGAENDLVNLHIRYTAGKHNLEELLRDLEKVFPRWYARDWTETTQVGPALVTGDADRSKSFSETVRSYLEQELATHTDEERAALLSLADELISTCE